MTAADSEPTAFSAIFRQTPTDVTAEVMEDDEEEAETSERWEMSYEGQSEYSGGLSKEPSAAHWADLDASADM